MGRPSPASCSDCLLRLKPVFGQFRPDQLRFVRGMKLEHVVLPGGSQLVQAQETNHLYTLFEGWAMRYRVLDGGRRQILDFMLPGDLIGLNARLLAASGDSVAALTGVSLCVLDGHAIGRLFHEQPELALGLLRTVAQDQQRADQRIVLLGQMDAPERLGYLLLELNERLAQRGMAAGGCYALPASTTHIADALGLSRSHLMRALRQLRQQQLADIEAGTARILSVQQLSQLSRFTPARGTQELTIL